MGKFRDWLFENFNNSSFHVDSKTFDMIFKIKELMYSRYAQQIVAERYGSMLSQCDFTTYIKGEIVEKDVWYRLNVEPNPNQSSSEFMRKLAEKLILNGEALIIKTETGDLYVAESFMKTGKQMQETRFEQIVIDIYDDDSGVMPLQLNKTFFGDNAIYIRYQNIEALNLIKQMNYLYSDLIKHVRKAGSSAIKYALSVDTTAMNGVNIDIKKEFEKIVNDDFNALASEDNAMIPLLNGFKIDVLNPSNNNAQNSAVASNNVNNMFEDICTNVGNIYNIPKSFMNGTYEKNDMDEFLTLGLDPLASLISEGFNRKYYGKKQILEKTYCRLDTKKVKHFDILTISDSINKLISSGVYTINEIREFLDEPLIDAEIGDKHWITRNYAVVGDYIQEMTNYSGNDPKTQSNN